MSETMDSTNLKDNVPIQEITPKEVAPVPVATTQDYTVLVDVINKTNEKLDNINFFCTVIVIGIGLVIGILATRSFFEHVRV
ncbi:MAG: hypothetical protein RR812_07480 [Vagococcus sp.]